MITELTKEQEAKLPHYRDKWLKIGLSTEPCNREEAEKWAIEAYKIADLAPPKMFLWYDCPTTCAIAQYLMKENESNVDKLEFLIKKELKTLDKEKVRTAIRDQIFGCHDANWLSFYDFFLNECDLKVCEKLVPLSKLAENCGWWAPYSEFCFMQEKPLAIHFDEDKKLHRETGPAIEFRGGQTKIYAIHGTRVPDWFIETPKDEIDPKKILALTNAEQRMVCMKSFGLGKMLNSLEHKVLDKRDEYRLLGIKLVDRFCEFLEMLNPSTGEVHIEGVPPDTKTVSESLAWRAGLKVYVNPVMKT